MDILYKSCVGIDVYQSNIVFRFLHSSVTSTHPKREETHFDTTTSGLTDCRDFLSHSEVDPIGMEKQ